MVIDTINADLKIALLAGNRQAVDVLKSLKTALQYGQVEKGAGSQLSEGESMAAIKKEYKKRQDAANLYKTAGQQKRASDELAEAEIIKKYLPEAMSPENITKLVENAITKLSEPSMKDMGKVISEVMQASNNTADGALVAKITRERLS